jgi:Icc-related predicted phosphoesterase
VRAFVLDKKPAVLVCGHVHERHLSERLEGTVIAKVGTLMHKKAIVLSMPERKVKLL